MQHPALVGQVAPAGLAVAHADHSSTALEVPGFTRSDEPGQGPCEKLQEMTQVVRHPVELRIIQ